MVVVVSNPRVHIYVIRNGRRFISRADVAVTAGLSLTMPYQMNRDSQQSTWHGTAGTHVRVM